MKNKFNSIRNHFYRHRFAYGVATGLTAAGYLAMKRADEWNEFLEEHNLLDEFYKLED